MLITCEVNLYHDNNLGLKLLQADLCTKMAFCDSVLL